MSEANPIDGFDRHPDCDREAAECRISRRHTTTTIAWTPVYDGRGRITNRDPNTGTNEMICATCGREWVMTTESGVSTFADRTASPA